MLRTSAILLALCLCLSFWAPTARAAFLVGGSLEADTTWLRQSYPVVSAGLGGWTILHEVLASVGPSDGNLQLRQTWPMTPGLIDAVISDLSGNPSGEPAVGAPGVSAEQPADVAFGFAGETFTEPGWVGPGGGIASSGGPTAVALTNLPRGAGAPSGPAPDGIALEFVLLAEPPSGLLGVIGVGLLGGAWLCRRRAGPPAPQMSRRPK